MRLSVVIVNYNVRYYLEQCLRSVFAAGEGMEMEVWVVDNNSTDGSVEMIRELFPGVRLVVNGENVGFARANNQALREIMAESNARGTGGGHVLLLNPDTLVQRDTLSTCLEFFASHEDCGALSVKMIDGEGRYLKESKRGFPSPATSFYKISGLIRVFPRSRRFGAYYMGHLDENATSEVEVLPGAFMMVRLAALRDVGLLDESYFMYGEDIDFSWRIHLAGYKNYYVPQTRILHYKGESTRKASMNYVYTFYNAMAIFARKYFAGRGARMYNLLIQLAIWLRASVDFAARGLQRLALPLLDFVLSLGGFVAIKGLWAAHKAVAVSYYPEVYTWVILPLYAVVLLLGAWLAGGYDRPLRLGRLLRGMGVGALALLVFYSLLGEELRFSRAIVLLGSLWSMVACAGLRAVLSLMGIRGFELGRTRRRRYMAIGSENEVERLEGLFDTMGIEHGGRLVRLDPQDEAVEKGWPKADEVVFCSRDVPVSRILDLTQRHADSGVAFRILPEGMNVLIGSNYTGSAEQLYDVNEGDISSITNRRSKRLLDMVASLLLLVLSPILFWVQQRRWRYFADCVSVLMGRKSWVGYSRNGESDGKRDGKLREVKGKLKGVKGQYNLEGVDESDGNDGNDGNDGSNARTRSSGASANMEGELLPALRRGVLRTRDRLPRVKNPDCGRLDRDYAEHYSIWSDVAIILININRL